MDVFSPLTLGGRTFPSRSVLAPMVLNLSTPDGRMTPALIASYEARAKAGLGYVVLGATFVLAEGRGFAYQSGIHDDAMLPGLGEIAARGGSHSPVGLQLSYKTMGRPADDFHVFRIKAIREAFGAAAVRARQAGFTAVELHACHDYLLNYFLSPHFNHRSDQYGGPLANRFRLLKEVVEEVRARVGGDLLLGVRLSLESSSPTDCAWRRPWRWGAGSPNSRWTTSPPRPASAPPSSGSPPRPRYAAPPPCSWPGRSGRRWACR